MSAQFHISSLIVHSRPERIDAVRAAVSAMAGTEIHAEAEGKFIVTLETDSDDDTSRRLHAIGDVPGVLSAALVYHQAEPLSDDLEDDA